MGFQLVFVHVELLLKLVGLLFELGEIEMLFLLELAAFVHDAIQIYMIYNIYIYTYIYEWPRQNYNVYDNYTKINNKLTQIM